MIHSEQKQEEDEEEQPLEIEELKRTSPNEFNASKTELAVQILMLHEDMSNSSFCLSYINTLPQWWVGKKSVITFPD